MDPLAALYYAVVCALLAGTLPPTLPTWGRYAVGAAVGAVAATVLPWLKVQILG